jgi:glycine cleavage system H protein
MSKIPVDLRYTKTHEWVRTLPGGLLELGITDHAQSELGELVFVEVPEPGRRLAVGEAYAVVESVKAASDVYSPIAGEVAVVNTALANKPELINEDPFGAGWIARLKPNDAAAAGQLLSAADYEAALNAEGD